MKRVFNGTLTLCAAVLALCSPLRVPAQNVLLHKPAPSFVRRDINGKTIRLRNYRGKVVLLNFWATWCVPCRLELPRFAALQRKYQLEGLQVIAVSMDDYAAPVRTVARSLALDFPVVMGDATLGERYGGVLGLPVTFLLARDGTIAARLEGESQPADIEERVERLLAQR